VANRRVIERFVTEVSADNTKFKKELQASASDAQKWGQEIKRSLGNAAKIGAGVLTGAAAVAALTINQTRKVIDEQAKLAQSLNTTFTGLANSRRAAELSGVAFSGLEQATKDLERRLSQAAGGAGPAAEALDRLNLSAEQLQQLPLDERISLINSSIDRFIPKAEQAAVAGQLFGEEGSLAIRRISPETIAEAARQVEIFGLNLTDIDASKVEMANDAMSTFGLLVDGAAQQLTVELAPVLISISNRFLDSAEEAGGMGTAIEDAVEQGVRSLAFLVDAGAGVGRTFQITARTAIASISGQIGFFLGALAEVVNAVDYVMLGTISNDAIEATRQAGREQRNVAAQAVEDIEKLLLKPLPGNELIKEFQKSKVAAQEAAAATAELKKIKDKEAAAAAAELKKLKALAVGPSGSGTVGGSLKDEAAKAMESNLKNVQAAIAGALGPQKKYAEQMKVIDSLLQAGELSQYEYNDVLAIYKQELEDATGAHEAMYKNFEDADSFIEASKTELERLNEELARAKELFAGGFLEAEDLAKTEDRIAKSVEEIKKAGDEMSVFAEQAARNIQDQFGASIRQTLEGDFDSILDSWKDLIYKMGSEALAADIAETLGLKDLLTGEGGDGILKKAFSSASSFFGGDKENVAASAVGAAGKTAESAASAAQLSSASLLSAAATALTGSSASLTSAAAASSASISAATTSLAASIPASLSPPAATLAAAGAGLNAAAAALSGAAAALASSSAASAASDVGKLASFDGGGFTGTGPRSGGIDGKGGFLSLIHPDETIIDHTKGQQGMGGNVSVAIQVNANTEKEGRISGAAAAREFNRMTAAGRRFR